MRGISQWFPRGLSVHVSHNVPLPVMRERKGLETPWVPLNLVTPNPPIAILASSFSQDSQKDADQRSPFSRDPVSRPSPPIPILPSPPQSRIFLSSCPFLQPQSLPPALFSPKQNPPCSCSGCSNRPFSTPLWDGAPFGLRFEFKGGTPFLSPLLHSCFSLTLYPYPLEA